MAASHQPVVMVPSRCGPRKARRSPPCTATPSVLMMPHSSSKCPSPLSWMKVSVCPSVCLSTCLSVCLSTCPSVCPHVCLSTCLSVHMPACPYACPSVYMSICPYVCLSVHPFFHLSVQLYFSLSYSVNLRYLKCYPIDDILFSKYKIRSFQRQKSEISDTLEGQTTAININWNLLDSVFC